MIGDIARTLQRLDLRRRGTSDGTGGEERLDESPVLKTQREM